MRSRKHGYRSIRFPEPLEARAMLSGSGLAPFAHLAQQFAESSGGDSTTEFVSSEHAGCGADSGSDSGSTDSSSDSSTDSAASSTTSSASTKLTATLSDATNSAATGTASYTTGTTDGVATTKLSVSISGAAASSTLDVSIAGTVVGQLTTDDTGAGSLVLASNPTGTEQSLPTDFPTDISANTAISVGTASGTFVAVDDTSGGCESVGKTSLTAALTDSSSTATGTATYKAAADGSSTVFSVTTTGAAASSTLDVAIDGTVVGQLTTDDTGAGSLVLSSNPTGTQELLPTGFPTSVTSGSTVTVGSLSGTLGVSDSNSLLAFHHFGRRR
jgi:trimeric autotransporter adhesin